MPTTRAQRKSSSFSSSSFLKFGLLWNTCCFELWPRNNFAKFICKCEKIQIITAKSFLQKRNVSRPFTKPFGSFFFLEKLRKKSMLIWSWPKRLNPIIVSSWSEVYSRKNETSGWDCECRWKCCTKRRSSEMGKKSDLPVRLEIEQVVWRIVNLSKVQIVSEKELQSLTESKRKAFHNALT